MLQLGPGYARSSYALATLPLPSSGTTVPSLCRSYTLPWPGSLRSRTLRKVRFDYLYACGIVYININHCIGLEKSKFSKTTESVDYVCEPECDVLYLCGYNEFNETSTWMIHGQWLHTIIVLLPDDIPYEKVLNSMDSEEVYDIDRDQRLKINFEVKKEFLESHVLQGWPHVKRRILRLSVPRLQQFYKLRNFLKILSEMFNLEICEGDYKPETRFIEENGLEYCSWIRIEKDCVSNEMDMLRFTRTSKEYIIYNKDAIDSVDRTNIPNIVTASIDIETINRKQFGSVPLPDNTDCVIWSIATTLHTVDKPEAISRHLHFLKHENTPKKITESYILEKLPHINSATIVTSEEQLVCSWKEFIVSTDPLFITGHNVLQYDLNWIVSRLPKRQKGLSVNLGKPAYLKRCTMDSRAHGQNDKVELICPGRIVVDFYDVIKKDMSVRLANYKLDTVAKKLLGAEEGK